MLKNPNLELYSLEFALHEIRKHSKDIIKKASINRALFELSIKELKQAIEFVPELLYANDIKEISKAFKTQDKYLEFMKDADFLALASALNCALWSNDKQLKAQSEIVVLNTEEMITII